ncbi:hypothetical protein BDF19DRAFT_415988 [Syncephalis fuscata]|nr:hypothetical protein BDF19DRAFT_415988 [Syncephalis fuscata]
MKVITIVLVLVLYIVDTVQSNTASVEFNSMQMLCLVNQLRRENGLPLLGIDNTLNAAAQEHSILQARNKQMAHIFDGEKGLLRRCSGYNTKWATVRENVAFGQATMSKAMEGWVNSPHHLMNLLSDATHFGSGLAISSQGVPHWTQDFGRDDNKARIIPMC